MTQADPSSAGFAPMSSARAARVGGKNACLGEMMQTLQGGGRAGARFDDRVRQVAAAERRRGKVKGRIGQRR